MTNTAFRSGRRFQFCRFLYTIIWWRNSEWT